ncbi:hypothetical protein ACQPW3_22465 [Actinosynnema sp. CA-248983]
MIRDSAERPVPEQHVAHRTEADHELLRLQRHAGNKATGIVVQRATRADKLAKLRAAISQGAWQEVATRLNGFNDPDIRQLAAGLSLGEAANTRAAVTQYLAGWPQEQMIVQALDKGRAEVARIGKIYAAYLAAVAKRDWKAASGQLAVMSAPDILTRVRQLPPKDREELLAQGDPRVAEAVGQSYGEPLATDYADVRNDLAYIDNFESASYDVFRRELHLTFEDGTEAAIPLAHVDLGAAPTVSPKVSEQVDRLQKSGDLTLPRSASRTPTIAVRGEEQFFHDPATGLLRPRTLHSGVTPRLHRAVKELDPDTQNLLFQAGTAFMAGPPMPEGAEFVLLLPIFARGGMGLRQALARAAERRAFTKGELAELAPVLKGKRPYASSLGELQEAGVMAKYAPGAKLMPPKAKSVDWYQGGAQTVVVRQEKYNGKMITIVETTVEGGTITQLHTVLERTDATAANVNRAVTVKLDKFFDLVHNKARKPARSPIPVSPDRPDTYERVILGKPDEIVVHIHLRQAKATPELKQAGQKALDNYPSKGDLPPARVVVTGQ